jgi:class III poly(R)-hydroxyalkanoic acid synthase PhaE subunit
MSEKGLFGEDWLEIQRKYWESWTDMSRKAMDLAGGAGGAARPGAGGPFGLGQVDLTKPWEGALDHWWKAWSPAAPQDSRDFMGHLIDQGKGFFRMAETFYPGAAAGDEDGWAAITKNLEDLQSRFMGGMSEGGDVFHRMMAFWELPYDNFQRMMSSMSPIPGDVLRNMPHDQVRGHIDRVLSAPGLGYTREEQGQYQDLMRCVLDYQKTLREYLGFYSHLGVKSVGRMRNYLQSVVESGKSIDSARAIYDNWVRCCEEVYAEEVSSPDYAALHGRLVNAQMSLKQRMSFMVDESLGAMNMPTRSELRTLQDRLQETRRENKRLRRELTALHRQVDALAQAIGQGQPEPATEVRASQSAPAPVASIQPAQGLVKPALAARPAPRNAIRSGTAAVAPVAKQPAAPRKKTPVKPKPVK